MKATAHPRTVFILTLVLAAGIFAFDVLTPLGFADWIFYLIPLFAVANWLHPRQIYLLVAVSTALIVLGYYFSPPAIDMTFAVSNRALQIAALWIVAFLLAQRRRMEEKLLVDQAELEDQVRARTADLKQELAERTRIQSSVDQLAAIVESSQDAIVGTDFDGRITSWNGGAERLYGHAAADVLGTNVFQLFLPGPPATVQPILEQIRQGKTISFTGHAWQTPAGERVVLDITLGPVMRNAGEVFGIASVARDVTPRKEAEDALAASQAVYRLLAENSSDAVSMIDGAGRVVYASPANARRLGYDEQEILGLDTPGIMQQIHPDDRPHIAQEIRRGRELKLPTSTYEYRAQTRHGDYIWLEDRLRREFDDQGNFVRTIVNSRDISERKQVEEALKASESRLKAIIENSDAAIWSVDREYRLLAANAVCERGTIAQIGRPLEQGESVLHETMPAQYIDFWRANYDRVLAGERLVLEAESWIQHRGGMVEIHLSPILEDGAITGVVGLSRDITERKRTEAALRASEERLRFALEATNEGLWDWNIQTGEVFVNDQWYAQYGYAPGEIEPSIQRWIDALHPDDAALAMQVVDDYAGGRGGRRGSEHRIVTRSGEIHWHQGMGKIVEWDADGRPLRIVGTNTDITERKVAEHKLREMNLELEQRVVERTVDLRSAIAELEQANVGKDAFMAAVSHELRTPLTGILTMSEILQSQARGPLNPQQVQYVAAIHESGQRLLATVNGVLHYTSLVGGVTPLQRENCRLVELCASAVRHVGADAEARGLQIRRTISPLDVQIESDAQGIIQILKELLENAVKFTPDGGHIDVTVMAVPEEDAVRLVVADDGIGMSAAQVATLFRPFSQGEQSLARRFGGLGLGLAYVHEMVARLGGSVAVASEPGCGSRFTVTLPALMPQWARS